MKKALIVPYFGKFNNYFSLWLYSCGKNKTIDWIVITDNDKPNELPSNIRWIKETFEELKQKISRKLNIKIWLENPYKLCDFRPAYGYLFEEYLTEYDFWGYCDCDVIFGDLEKFLPVDLFEKYDKLLRTGHLSFVRNSPEINENFLKYDTYKIVFSSPIAYAYDEAVDGYHLGFAGELIDQGFRFYCNDSLVADVDYRHYPFRLISDPERCCVFLYEDGRLFKLYKVAQDIMKEEIIYIHLQKRKMQVQINLNIEQYCIYPNLFDEYKDQLLQADSFWEKVSTEHEKYYSFAKEKRLNIIRDIKRFVYEPHKIDCLRYRFRK